MLNVLFHSRFWHRFLALAVVAAVFSAALAEDKQASKDAPTPINKPLSDGKPPKGFTALFNGKDFTGWHGMPHFDPYKLAAMSAEERKAQIEKWNDDLKKHWTVEKGEIVNDGNGVYLTTDKDYGDIELLIDYKMYPKGDSGIYLRATPQVQIWDYTKEGGKWNLGADKGSGGLWNNSPGAAGKDPLVLADKPFGEWNHFRILMLGERVTVYLNDKLVVHHARLENYFNRKLPLSRKGPIQLQTHGSEIRWRNVFRPRDSGGGSQQIAARNERFQRLREGFQRQGLQRLVRPDRQLPDQGRRHSVQTGQGRHHLHQGRIQRFCRASGVQAAQRGGGNNGLAVRYPGKGDTAYVGMCELQVLNDDYKGIDPRQAHGSAYGMVAAQRGYQRSIGEWNYQEVTVKGPTIKVELNGTRILDCDLSKVKEFMAKSAHPGKDRASGHFGFAGHNDPVAFRNIQIKRLESGVR